MKILRTKEERFEHLPGYPFFPNYQLVGDNLRLHYVDEGPKDGPVMLLLHGEPSWSYVYRKMIPPLALAGFRTIAPDLIGFGKSDKPDDMAYYSYARHVSWILEFIRALNLQNITLVCQDWGSLIGLRIAGEHSSLFGRIVVANGGLPIAEKPLPWAFRVWRMFAQFSPIFPIGRIVASGCVTKLTKEIRAAYDAPFPSPKYKAAARAFPLLVPMHKEDMAAIDNRRAWQSLAQWQKPFLTLFGKNDPILGKGDRVLQSHIPGSQNQPHERFWGGHFVQEDRGEYLAERIIRWVTQS